MSVANAGVRLRAQLAQVVQHIHHLEAQRRALEEAIAAADFYRRQQAASRSHRRYDAPARRGASSAAGVRATSPADAGTPPKPPRHYAQKPRTR